MTYIEVSFKIEHGVWCDLLMDTLGNQGPYESFVDTPDGMKAYVRESEFDEGFLRSTREAFPIPYTYKVEKMEDKDWNEEWEKKHESVVIESHSKSIYVRAPFHPHRTDIDYEIIIEPKMSFGTAHHPTTAMMVGYVADMEMKGKRVLDMGCGTAVLAILAKMRGAMEVDAIDIDEWAYRNAIDNAAQNGVEINVSMGDAASLSGRVRYDVVLANINRNILLHDMGTYDGVLREGGHLVISGFYEADEGVLIAKANELGMRLSEKRSREGWSALDLVKQ